jgi:glycosyltransferase involved in cell wall biosynthesis
MQTAERPALSIVVPVYNEEGNVEPLHDELAAVASSTGLSYEILFVNDGSRDGTLARLESILARDPHFRVVDLDGNFGEASALCAGFSVARGDVVVTLDGDGQNDPADIPKLLARLTPEVDVVSGRRLHREESFTTRVLPSWVANRMIVAATGVPVYDCGCGLKAYRREVLAGAQLPRGFNRFLPAILGVPGSRTAEIETRDRPRGSGESHYGLSRVAIVFRDLMAIPLLVRRPPAGRTTARTAGAAAIGLAVLALVALLRSHVGLALLLALATGVAAAIRWNVERFVKAREHGVFRVRGVLHGNDTEHRHRGRGVLGQESPADVRQAADGARRGAL